MNKVLTYLVPIVCLVIGVAGSAYATGHVLEAQGVVQSEEKSEAGQEAGREASKDSSDEFADYEKITVIRIVRESNEGGIDTVNLDPTEENDGFGAISVDKVTELGREILKVCPGGSKCKLTAIITNGTLTRIYNIQKTK